MGELESQLDLLAERLASLPSTLSPGAIYKQMEKLQAMKGEADGRLDALRQKAAEGQVPAEIESYQALLHLVRVIRKNPSSKENSRITSKMIRALIEKIEVLPEGYKIHFKVGQNDIGRGLSQLGSLATQNEKAAESAAFSGNTAPQRGQRFMVRELLTYGDPDRIRTCDLMLRRHLLYPSELRDRKERRKPTFLTTLALTNASLNRHVTIWVNHGPL